jgi:hypothetical protein
MKQLAVEWLAIELWEKFEMKGDGLLYDDILNKAKEMEKQQQGYSEEDMKQAFEDGMANIAMNNFEFTVDKWFEQFKKK